MDENARVHRDQNVKNYVTENDINATLWPTQSLDLNLIENIWSKIKWELQSVATNIGIRHELFKELRLSENDSVDYVGALYDNIPTRVKQDIMMKGNSAKF